MAELGSINDRQDSAVGENLSSYHHADDDRPVVLVVDDSNTVLRSATDYLNDIGLSVVTARDGFEALAKVVDIKPAMLFVDIMMPRLDGYQACALIKNNADLRSIPVIMLSSKDGLFDRARGRVAGADDHLAKPFNATQLTAMVEKYLDERVLNLVSNAKDANAADTKINS